jgi:hypothetical protein
MTAEGAAQLNVQSVGMSFPEHMTADQIVEEIKTQFRPLLEHGYKPESWKSANNTPPYSTQGFCAAIF